ncbi:MAG: LacI family DNA-binding transcriptional regulator [Chloroflexota bacterium]
MNDKGEISPRTKNHVLEIVEQLGYRPSRVAQAMNTQRSYMVGFVVPDITNPFFPEVVRGAQDAAADVGYNVLLCNTDGQPKSELAVMELLSTQGVDGIIAFGFNVSMSEINAFANTFNPIVFINSHYDHPNVSTIMVQNDLGARLAVEYFVGAGHTQIGMLSNRLSYPGREIRRERGFIAALHDFDMPFSDAHIVHTEPHLSGGYEGTKTLLKRNPQITGIFAYNDLMGLGAIRACLDLGKQVPQDVAIIGFDDIQLNRMTYPSLSSIRVDKYKLGALAMQRILNLIESPVESFPDLEMGLTLVHRESTKTSAI